MADLNKAIFIVGVGRSGTTLLQCMLNAHSRVCFLPETHFLRHYPGVPGVADRIRRRGMTAIWSRLANDPDIRRVGPDLLADILDERPDTLAGFYRTLLDRYAEIHRAERVGEKDPKNIEILPVIRGWFPEARIIHVVRDPRDVVVSRMRAEWSRGRCFLAHLIACREQLHLGRTEGPALFGSNYREIRYEDLISRPEETLSNVCEWMELEYESGMLTFQRSARELIQGREEAWKKECSGPLLTDNTGKYSGVLSRRRILRIEAVCREAFNRFGYPISRPAGAVLPGNRLEMWVLNRLFRAIDILYSFIHKRKMRGLLIEHENQP